MPCSANYTCFRRTGKRDFPLEQVERHILPGVRSRGARETANLVRRIEEGDGDDIPFRVLATHLGVELAIALPQTIAPISNYQLSTWNRTFEETLSVGMENLRRASPQRLRRLERGLFVSDWRDDFDASRLLLPDLFSALTLRGLPVVTIPNRQTLIVTGSEDIKGLKTMARLTADGDDQPWPRSSIPLVLQNDEWAPFVLPRLHPCYGAFRRLELTTVARSYASQGDALTNQHSIEGDPVFAASFMRPNPASDREQVSVTCWTSALPSLLPKADTVAFIQAGLNIGEVHIEGIATWQECERVLGDHMERLDIYPPRYRVEVFPTPEQLEQIRMTEDSPDETVRIWGPS